MRTLLNFFIEAAGPALFVIWIVYMGFMAIAGGAGFRTLWALEEDVAAAAQEVDLLTRQRQALERRADMLNPRSLDPDMVDESIRVVLGYAHEDDIVLPRQEIDRLRRKND
ncbi:MAG: septum formation initiator family protein [Pseudomonadota bacterium]